MNEIPRKWEWIADVLERIFITDEPNVSFAIDLANSIDRTIHRLYGNEHTKVWAFRYDHIKGIEYAYDKKKLFEEIISIACASGTCTPCMHSINEFCLPSCSICRFALEHGVCNEDGSSFSEFMYRMNIIRGIYDE